MNPTMSARILVTLSVAYGLTVGILATIDSSATTTVATIGAILLGVLWVVRGIFIRRVTG